jgi:putative FmdB family regulatory protein
LRPVDTAAKFKGCTVFPAGKETMPTYEYLCANGHAFERFQKMTDKPVGKCPTCGARAARKISGGQGLIFKGSGFYITDYGKDGKGPRKDSEAAPAAAGGGDGGDAGSPASAAEPAGPAKAETPKKGSGGKADAA